MKTLVFAYSEFGCIGIEALLAAGYAVEAVFTYRDDPRENVFYRSVARLCIDHGIPAYTIDAENAEARFALMQSLAPDYLFSFYYRSLLPDRVLTLAEKGAFNLHGSLLPHYRGRAPVNWVLVNGEKQTGVTLHRMVTKADAGDIVAQIPVEIGYDDTAFTLQHKLLAAAKRLLQAQLPLIAQGKTKATPQPLGKSNYYGRRTSADGLIDWHQPAEMVRNLVRAVTFPYPGAFTYTQGRKLFLWEASVAQVHGEPGTILSIAPLTIGCGDDALAVRCGQLEEGLYLSGYQLPVEYGLTPGMRLGAAS